MAEFDFGAREGGSLIVNRGANSRRRRMRVREILNASTSPTESTSGAHVAELESGERTSLSETFDQELRKIFGDGPPPTGTKQASTGQSKEPNRTKRQQGPSTKPGNSTRANQPTAGLGAYAGGSTIESDFDAVVENFQNDSAIQLLMSRRTSSDPSRSTSQLENKPTNNTLGRSAELDKRSHMKPQSRTIADFPVHLKHKQPKLPMLPEQRGRSLPAAPGIKSSSTIKKSKSLEESKGKTTRRMIKSKSFGTLTTTESFGNFLDDIIAEDIQYSSLELPRKKNTLLGTKTPPVQNGNETKARAIPLENAKWTPEPDHSKKLSSSKAGFFSGKRRGLRKLLQKTKSSKGHKARLANSPPEQTEPAFVITNDTRIFGVPLAQAVMKLPGQISDLPDIVNQCLSYLKARGLESEGIFRLSGSNEDVTRLRDACDSGLLIQLDDVRDPNTVASLLKLFFRTLPDCLFRKELGLVVSTDAPQSEKERVVRSVISTLSVVQYTLLKRLFSILQSVASLCHINKMDAKNLAIVWSPSLRTPPNVIQFFIKAWDRLFADDVSFKAL